MQLLSTKKKKKIKWYILSQSLAKNQEIKPAKPNLWVE